MTKKNNKKSYLSQKGAKAGKKIKRRKDKLIIRNGNYKAYGKYGYYKKKCKSKESGGFNYNKL